jgi:hypothetical protein
VRNEFAYSESLGIAGQFISTTGVCEMHLCCKISAIHAVD